MNFVGFRNTIKKLKLLLIAFVVLGLSLGAWSVFSSRYDYIPQSFIDAKRETAIVGDQIVGLSSESSSGIEKIQKLQASQKYSEALEAVNAEKGRVTDMRNKASDLLINLSLMTQSVSEISPETSRTAALQAINYETGIVSHLLIYNESLDKLLQLITSHVLYGEDVVAEFNDTIEKTNAEISTINDLNNKFTEAMVLVEMGSK